jgi:putative phosphoribosyl transferase
MPTPEAERSYAGGDRGPATEEILSIRIGGESIHGDLSAQTSPRGIVLFAHGSGSSRHSPRNRHTASRLRGAGFATLLVDLLTESEQDVDLVTRHLRFDLALLVSRLELAIARIRSDGRTSSLPLGLFGAGTGAAAALTAAARLPGDVGAVVSRGGRPDLVVDMLPMVKAPTLLIVAERDPNVLQANQGSQGQLTTVNELEVVPAATRLFEETGALEHVAGSAVRWFNAHLEGRSP